MNGSKEKATNEKQKSILVINKKSFVTASVILGFVSIGLAFFSIQVGAIGFILGILGVQDNKKGWAIAGIILNSIAIILSITISFMKG